MSACTNSGQWSRPLLPKKPKAALFLPFDARFQSRALEMEDAFWPDAAIGTANGNGNDDDDDDDDSLWWARESGRGEETPLAGQNVVSAVVAVDTDDE